MKWNMDDGEPDRSLTWIDREGDIWSFEDGGWGWRNPWASTRYAEGTWEVVCREYDGGFPWVPENRGEPGFVVKDSGVREEYANGFVRDTEDGKPDFSAIFTNPQAIRALANPDLQAFLCTPGSHLVPFDVFMPRVAEHMRKGAEKYGEANWRQAVGDEPVNRFGRSLDRHFLSYRQGMTDEDHAAGIFFNLSAREIKKEESARDDADE